jgi:hypothetical protein
MLASSRAHMAPVSTQTRLRNAANMQTNRPGRRAHLRAAASTAAPAGSHGDRGRDAAYWKQIAGTGRQQTADGASRPSASGIVSHGQYVNGAVVDNGNGKGGDDGRRVKRSFVADTATRIRGVAYDLGKWDQLPVKGGVGAKIKYVFGRDQRPWTMAGLLGCLLVAVLVIVGIYFAVKAEGKSRLSGGAVRGGIGGIGGIGATGATGGTSFAQEDPLAAFDTGSAVMSGGGGGGGGGGDFDPDLLSGEFPFIEFD